MKKFFITTFVAAAFLTSCGGGEESKENEESTEAKTEEHAGHDSEDSAPAADVSTVGHWNADDKAKADAAIAAIDADLAPFGDKKQDFIDCYLGKIENNYSSFASADSDLQGCSAIAEQCANEVMGM